MAHYHQIELSEYRRLFDVHFVCSSHSQRNWQGNIVEDHVSLTHGFLISIDGSNEQKRDIWRRAQVTAGGRVQRERERVRTLEKFDLDSLADGSSHDTR